jgi:hypothetical protein
MRIHRPRVKNLSRKKTSQNGHQPMEFKTYVRKPFTVQAIEITNDNISEVSRYIGEAREREDGTKYILVDQRLVPNIDRVYPGFFMTKMGDNIRCWSKKVFKEQFLEETDEIKPWLEFMKNQGS